MPLDQFHGQGGSYVVNEKGERELVERTMTQQEADAKAKREQASAAKQTTQPGKEK